MLDKEEGRLMTFLTDWEHRHLVQREFKKKNIDGDATVILTDAEEFEAVDSMLQLKSDLIEEYASHEEEYPYS